MSLEGKNLGHYRLMRMLGSGGMGEVYLAEDARIGQRVAIKVIRTERLTYPENASSKEAARLFEREAKAIAQLDHPNILPLYAYGEEMLHDRQLTYLVMPYRKDGTLANWLQRLGHTELLTPIEVAPLLQQAADALQHAHDQQIIHQDIKPTNFLIRLRPDQANHPDLLLADFGIAKLTSATASTSQSIRGTPTYMAPEQWDGHPVTATDQYALAIMVYELLVGRPPFQGGPGQVMRQHYMTPAPSPSTLNPRLSSAIDAVLLRALSKRPDERFASIVAFACAFQEAMQSRGELQATLAISRVEAEAGTTRRLTLPGRRQVSVTVPAGVGEGTTLHLEGQGMPYFTGGPAGSLVLTITISAEEKNPLSFQQDSEEPTVLVSKPTLQIPSGVDSKLLPVSFDTPAAPGVTIPTSQESSDVLPALSTHTPFFSTEVVATTTQSSLPVEEVRSTTPQSINLPVKVSMKPTKRRGSRHFVLIGLVSLVIIAFASSMTWFILMRAAPTQVNIPRRVNMPTGSITEFAIATAGSRPTEITAGPDGNLWFTEAGASQIGRITPTGSITEFATPTTVSMPMGITKGPDGNLWFTEFWASQIGRITPTGSITEFTIPNHDVATEITAGPDGNLWFTEGDAYSNKIGRITPTGSVTEFAIPTFSTGGGPSGITAGPDGNLWFTEQGSGKIGRITPAGNITEFAIPTSASRPTGITAGPDGNLWFTDQGPDKIGRITPTGSVTEFTIPTVRSLPAVITAGPDGNLWFTEQGPDKIGRITPSGSITEFAIPSASWPIGITAGPDGNLWFTERGSDKIGRIISSK